MLTFIKIVGYSNYLLSNESNNIRYGFQLYRAETLQAIEQRNTILLKQANQNWEKFVHQLSDEDKKNLSDITESVESIRLPYYVSIEDNFRFDQSINRLSKRYLYDDENVTTIYNFYIKRGLHELAFDYINKTQAYLQEAGKSVSQQVENILKNAESVNLTKSLKQSLSNIRNLNAKNIPLILPDIVNDRRTLNEFVLNEIIKASKVFLNKIQAIKTITHENRYNDLFLAILTLRFEIWGWSIHDQPRVGNSPTGLDAGSADIVFQAGSTPFALLEPLILTGKKKKETQEHVLKVFDYISYLERYYMIVYYKGKPTNFNSTWNSYKEDVASSAFPTQFLFNTTKGFEDLTADFDDVQHLHIAKTTHGSDNKIEMFHVMIDLSSS